MRRLNSSAKLLSFKPFIRRVFKLAHPMARQPKTSINLTLRLKDLQSQSRVQHRAPFGNCVTRNSLKKIRDAYLPDYLILTISLPSVEKWQMPGEKLSQSFDCSTFAPVGVR